MNEHRRSYTASERVQALPVLQPLRGEDALPTLEPLLTGATLESLPPLEPVPLELELLTPEPSANIFVRAFRAVASGMEWLFGAFALMIALAALAALPIVQFLSLGYLLEAGGRVARSGRLRDAFIGIRLAARLGGAVMASWLLLLPVRFVAAVARDAQLIDPGGRVARNWRIGLFVLIVVTALHIASACARGGKLRYFLWPFNLFWLIRQVFRGGYYTQARDAVWNTVVSLRLPYYFSLGFRGFVAALSWLIVPITLLALGSSGVKIAPLFGFLGALILGVVLLYLPFLQMRMAMENRLWAGFDLGAVRQAYKRAPWMFCLAVIVTLLSALPLYLLKIEMIPSEAAWLPSLVFIAMMFPARILTGWALARSKRREEPRHWFFRWTAWTPFLPVAAFYVLIVYFTQFTSWNGIASLYEQHAFLVPVPFFGM